MRNMFLDRLASFFCEGFWGFGVEGLTFRARVLAAGKPSFNKKGPGFRVQVLGIRDKGSKAEVWQLRWPRVSRLSALRVPDHCKS